jgi:hypothetical protein
MYRGIISKLIATFIILFSFQNCGEMNSINEHNARELSSSGQAIFQSSSSSDKDFASLIYQRLGVKVPIDHPSIISMRKKINEGSLIDAARIAVESDHFLNVTVRDFAAKMSNREQLVNVPLNDFIATIIGATRDNVDARQLLTGDFFYWAPDNSSMSDIANDVVSSNNHFEDLDENFVNLAQDLVISNKQYYKNSVSQAPQEMTDSAGVITSRAFMSAHAAGGTNRRLVEFSMNQFLCSPIESWADGSLRPGFIGRDITRLPKDTFDSKCKSCHAPMDAMRPAFAHVDFSNGFLSYKKVFATDPNDNGSGTVPVANDEQLVPSKFRRGKDTFPSGHVVKDDQWHNLLRNNMGWRTSKSGQGMKAFGEMLSESREFSRCMAKRAYETVCYKKIDPSQEQLIVSLADVFENSGYQLKELFAHAIIDRSCIGDVK